MKTNNENKKLTNRQRLENNLEENKLAVQSHLSKDQHPALIGNELAGLLPKPEHLNMEIISQDMFAVSITQLSRMRDERMGITWKEETNSDGSKHIIRDARQAEYKPGEIPPVNGVESFYIQHLNIARSALFMLDEQLKDKTLSPEALLKLEVAKDNLSQKVQKHMEDMNVKFNGYMQDGEKVKGYIDGKVFSDKGMQKTTLEFNKEVCDILESGGLANVQKDLNAIKNQVAIFNDHCHFSTITKAKDKKGKVYNKVENDTLLIGITDEQREMFKEIQFLATKAPEMGDVELKILGDDEHESKPKSKQESVESPTGHDWYDTLTKEQKSLALLYIKAVLEEPARPIRLSSQVMSILPTLRNAAITTTMLSKEINGSELEVLSQHSHSGVPAYLGKGEQEEITRQNIEQLKSFFPEGAKINDVMLISPANLNSKEPKMAELMRNAAKSTGIEVTSTPFNIFRFQQTIKRALGLGKEDYASYVETLKGVGNLIQENESWLQNAGSYLKNGKNLGAALEDLKTENLLTPKERDGITTAVKDKITELYKENNQTVDKAILDEFLNHKITTKKDAAKWLNTAFNNAEEKLKKGELSEQEYQNIKKGFNDIRQEFVPKLESFITAKEALYDSVKIAVEARRVIDNPSLIKDTKENSNLVVNDLMQEVQNSAHLKNGGLQQVYGNKAQEVVPINHSHCKSGKDREGINRFYNAFKSAARKLGISEEKDPVVYKENLQSQAVGGHTQFSADIYTGTPGTQKESNFAQPKFFKDNMKGLQQDTAGFNKVKIDPKHKTPQEYLVSEESLKKYEQKVADQQEIQEAKKNPEIFVEWANKFANAKTYEDFETAAKKMTLLKETVPENYKHFVPAAESFIKSEGKVDLGDVTRVVIDPVLHSINPEFAPKAKEYVETFVNNLQNKSTISMYANNYLPSFTNIYNNSTIAIYETTKQGSTERGDQLIKGNKKVILSAAEDAGIDKVKAESLRTFITEHYSPVLHFISETTGKDKDLTALITSGSFWVAQDSQFIDRWKAHHALREEFLQEIKEFIKNDMQNPEAFEAYLKNTSQKVIHFIEDDVKMLPKKQRKREDGKGDPIEVDFSLKGKQTSEQMLADLEEKSKALSDKPLGLLTKELLEKQPEKAVIKAPAQPEAKAEEHKPMPPLPPLPHTPSLEVKNNQPPKNSTAEATQEKPKKSFFQSLKERFVKKEQAPMQQDADVKKLTSLEMSYQNNLQKYTANSDKESDKILQSQAAKAEATMPELPGVPKGQPLEVIGHNKPHPTVGEFTAKVNAHSNAEIAEALAPKEKGLVAIHRSPSQTHLDTVIESKSNTATVPNH